MVDRCGVTKRHRPVRTVASRHPEGRSSLRFYRAQLRQRSHRSRLIILNLVDRVREREQQVEEVRRESDDKLSQIWQQLVNLQSNLSKEQTRLSHILQDKENIIQSQRIEILQLRDDLKGIKSGQLIISHETDTLKSNGSVRKFKRERNSIRRSKKHSEGKSSTDEKSGSSPDSTPKEKNRVLTCQYSLDHNESGERTLSQQKRRSSNLEGVDQMKAVMRQAKFIRGSERPVLKTMNLQDYQVEDRSTENGVKEGEESDLKPPVPSRSRINEKLKARGVSPGSTNTTPKRRELLSPSQSSPDSGNSSLDSSDPSSSLEWRLSVRSTLPTKPNLITNNNTFSYYHLNATKRSKNTPPVGPKPHNNVKVKPPPIYRRSKSHERPNMQQGIILRENKGLHPPSMQSNFEEYDLSAIDLVERSESKPTKKVSFSSEEMPREGRIQDLTSKPLLKKMPSYSSLIITKKPDTGLFPSRNDKPETVESVVNIETDLAPDSVIRKLLNENVLLPTSDKSGNNGTKSDKHLLF